MDKTLKRVLLLLSALLACLSSNGQVLRQILTTHGTSVAPLTIAFDAVTETGYSASGNLTWSHTCTGSHLSLVVFVWSRTTDTVTAATYNGVAMTAIPGAKNITASTAYIYAFILANPAAGAHNVVVTATAETFGTSLSYTGTAAAGQPDNAATTQGTLTAAGTAAPASLTVNTANSWIIGRFVDTAVGGASWAWSPGGGHTVRNMDATINVQTSDSAAGVSTGSQSYNGVANGGNVAGAFVASLVSLKPGP